MKVAEASSTAMKMPNASARPSATTAMIPACFLRMLPESPMTTNARAGKRGTRKAFWNANCARSSFHPLL
jgi:hypothetical protein